MRVSVTSEDIRLGLRGNPCECAVALAVGRLLTGCTIEVSPGLVYLFGGEALGLPPTADLPEAVTEWIIRFDRLEPVNPIEFELPLEAAAA